MHSFKPEIMKTEEAKTFGSVIIDGVVLVNTLIMFPPTES